MKYYLLYLFLVLTITVLVYSDTEVISSSNNDNTANSPNSNNKDNNNKVSIDKIAAYYALRQQNRLDYQKYLTDRKSNTIENNHNNNNNNNNNNILSTLQQDNDIQSPIQEKQGKQDKEDKDNDNHIPHFKDLGHSNSLEHEVVQYMDKCHRNKTCNFPKSHCYNQVVRFMNTTVPPNYFNYTLYGEVPPYLYYHNATGFFNTVGGQPNYTWLVEYIYASEGPPPPSLTGFRRTGFVLISYSEQNCIVNFKYNQIFTDITGNASNPVPLTLDCQFVFKEGLIYQLSCDVLNQDIWTIDLGLDYTNPVIQEFGIIDLCQQLELYCTGIWQQYSSYNACIEYNTNNIPYGGIPYFVASNSIMCRDVHVAMAWKDPIHCTHAGPTGNTICVDHPYSFLYNSYQSFPQPFLPCDDPSCRPCKKCSSKCDKPE